MIADDIIKEVAKRTEFGALDIRKIFWCIVAVTVEELMRGGQVRIRAFGKFVTRRRPERVLKLPGRGEKGKKVVIPNRKVILFLMGKSLRRVINNGADASREYVEGEDCE
jgi:nucleoid DNA-binding protein